MNVVNKERISSMKFLYLLWISLRQKEYSVPFCYSHTCKDVVGVEVPVIESIDCVAIHLVVKV